MRLLYLFFALFLSMNLYGQETVRIGNIENRIVLGPLANNRDLAFGVRNILEEVIQDKGLDLDEASPLTLKVEILYFDVLKNNIICPYHGYSFNGKNGVLVDIPKYNIISKPCNNIESFKIIEKNNTF
jgi:hypothetical protein